MATAANVANRIHPRQRIRHPTFQPVAIGGNPSQQPFTRDDLLHRNPCGTGGGVAGEGVARPKSAVLGADHFPHGTGADGSAQGHIARRQPLGDRHNIRLYPVIGQGAPSARAPCAAHHLVRDHQNTVFGANLAHQFGIAVGRGHAAPCRANHRFKDKGGDGVRPFAQNGCFQFRRTGRPHRGRIRPRHGAIGVGGRQFDRRDKGPLISRCAFGKA